MTKERGRTKEQYQQPHWLSIEIGLCEGVHQSLCPTHASKKLAAANFVVFFFSLFFCLLLTIHSQFWLVMVPLFWTWYSVLVKNIVIQSMDECCFYNSVKMFYSGQWNAQRKTTTLTILKMFHRQVSVRFTSERLSANNFG